MDLTMPTAEDLSLSYEPQTGRQKVETIRRIRNMHRAFGNKARSTKLTKQLTAEYGIAEDELDDNENTAPPPLDRGSARRWDMQPEPPSGLDRGVTDEGWQGQDWDDNFEPKR